jgi:hypothetical protein
MSPKEKARELFEKHYEVFICDEDEHYLVAAKRIAKECAFISVDEILKNDTIFLYVHHLDFWKQVKHEIEKI